MSTDTKSLEAVKTQRVLYDESMKSAQMMPAEFSTAAYRLVHSRVRTNYRLSSNSDTFIFFDVGNGDRNLLGGSPLPADMEIEWDFFFENPNADTLGGRGRGRTQTGSGRIMVSSSSAGGEKGGWGQRSSRGYVVCWV